MTPTQVYAANVGHTHEAACDAVYEAGRVSMSIELRPLVIEPDQPAAIPEETVLLAPVEVVVDDIPANVPVSKSRKLQDVA